MEMESKEQIYNIKKGEPDKTEIVDNYDLYGMVTDVHSPVEQITRDFTLAKLTNDVIKQPLPKFITNQIKTMQIIKDYLQVPKNKLILTYGKEHWESANKRIQAIIKSVQNLIMSEIYSIVIMSRSANGEILNSILTHNHGIEEAQQITDTHTPTTKEKLMEKRAQ